MIRCSWFIDEMLRSIKMKVNPGNANVWVETQNNKVARYLVSKQAELTEFRINKLT